MNRLAKLIAGSLCLALAVSLPAAPLSASAAASSQQKPPAQHQPKDPERIRERLEKEVRHELVMLSFLTVFDNLAFQVDGDKVTLLGQVTQPVLKSDAENAVKRIEGVETVVNNIEVLPLSPNDDRIRRGTYRAIYGHPALQRYSFMALEPIRIVVKNGHVTLEGVVATEMEKTIAKIQANGVHGAFSVTDNLRVENKEEKKK
jgi:hyperosmotically inducible protein